MRKTTGWKPIPRKESVGPIHRVALTGASGTMHATVLVLFAAATRAERVSTDFGGTTAARYLIPPDKLPWLHILNPR